MEKNHVNKNAHAQIRTNQISLGLASAALAITLLMSGFYIADTTTGDTHLRNVLATLGFCEKLDNEPTAAPSAPAGSDGSDGSIGTPGQDGSSGTDGQDGSSGSDGSDGTSGSNGTNGSDGTSGSDGSDGAAGSDGSAGADGANGTDGATGSPGSNGEPGATGAPGEKGDTGEPGPTGPAGPCTYILDLALIDGNLVPSIDNTYTLGSPEFRWKDLQLGPGTLFIEDPETGKQVAITVNDGSLLLDGADSLRIGNIRLTAAGIESILSDQDITIGNLGDTGDLVLARGLRFPDGTIQSTAAGAGSVGAEGPRGPQGPAGPKGDPGSIANFIEQAACVEDKQGSMIGPIELGTCAQNNKNGTDIKILMRIP